MGRVAEKASDSKAMEERPPGAEIGKHSSAAY